MKTRPNLYKTKFEVPTGDGELERFEQFIHDRLPFTFIRFSDGETEILHNRKLVISDGITEFRGERFNNQFPEFDKKVFNPVHNQDIRRDLLEAATFQNNFFFKGIPTWHNNAVSDREFMLRLNGGYTPQITFSDLFLNSNFIRSRQVFFPLLINSSDEILVVGNWRCELKGLLNKGKLIQIPDNFFSTYSETLDHVLTILKDAPDSALILSSASSLSNILGHKLRIIRPDLTFLDIGTALNDLIGLPLGTRTYHNLIKKPCTLSERIELWRYSNSRGFKLKW